MIDLVFIVPYRNRTQHKHFFTNYLSSILPKDLSYEVYFSHQCDERSFNRGATKNIGFLAVKRKYPHHYKNITFVFNDIDTIPYKHLFQYKTTRGTVKHFYGFRYALGGIVSITGEDFEKINGFPNFWGWGMEDNVLQTRCEKNKILIDRSQFYPIGNPNILQLFDGIQRIINKKDPWRAKYDDGVDGISTIHNLNFNIVPNDEISSHYFMINITSFLTNVTFESDSYHKYDLREPPRKIIHPDKLSMISPTQMNINWSDIPSTIAPSSAVSTKEHKLNMIENRIKQFHLSLKKTF